MIIDTNGFEIGDEVWCGFHSMGSREITPAPFIIKGFKYYIDKLILVSNYDIECNSKNTYKSQSECQLACDKLNGK